MNELPNWIKWSKVKGKYVIIRGKQLTEDLRGTPGYSSVGEMLSEDLEELESIFVESGSSMRQYKKFISIVDKMNRVLEKV